MHDLHVADKVYKLIKENAAQNGLQQVKIVEINLGSIVEHGADISAENLDFNLRTIGSELLSPDAQIKINKVEGNDWELVSISG